jgi:EAL domain-containing protein (putative c-di-GMP-specific phosphodiesterase class I)
LKKINQQKEIKSQMESPRIGIIPRRKFIPLTEETGLIVPLGVWILRESCRQTAAWQDKDYPPLNLSVNVSVRQLEDLNFVDKVKTILHDSGVDLKRLELEITENVLANVKGTISILKEIRELGIRISVDNFGTGYSAFNPLATICFIY